MSNKEKGKWHSYNDFFKIYLFFSESHLKKNYDKLFSDLLKKAEDTEEYAELEKIATEVHQKFLGLDRKERVIRDIILGFHLEIEREFDLLLNLYFTIGGGTRKTRAEFGTMLLPKLEFKEKVGIIRKLKLLNRKSISDAEKINEIRNGFAHGYDKGSRRFYYRGDYIFRKRTVDRVIEDYKSILKDISQRVNGLLENFSQRMKSEK